MRIEEITTASMQQYSTICMNRLGKMPDMLLFMTPEFIEDGRTHQVVFDMFFCKS